MHEYMLELLEALATSSRPRVVANEVNSDNFGSVISNDRVNNFVRISGLPKSQAIEAYMNKKGSGLRQIDLYTHFLNTQHRFSNNAFCMNKSWIEGLGKTKYDTLTGGLKIVASRWNEYLTNKSNRLLTDSENGGAIKYIDYGNKSLSEAVFDRRKPARESLAKKLDVEYLHNIIH